MPPTCSAVPVKTIVEFVDHFLIDRPCLTSVQQYRFNCCSKEPQAKFKGKRLFPNVAELFVGVKCQKYPCHWCGSKSLGILVEVFNVFERGAIL